MNMPVEFLSADLGHVLPKIKILVGFLQVLAYLPVVFSIPWPPVFVEWLSSLRFLSLDIFAPLLALSCNLRGGFLPIFALHMGMIPLLFVVAILANSFVRCVKRNKHHQNTHLFQALDLIVFATYAGVCSRIFVFFRCVKVDQAWYLLADMRVRCFIDAWNTSRSLAIVCVLCLMIGIPCVYVVAMFTHRRYLHDRDEFHDAGNSSSLTKHRRIKNILGSVYGPYRSAFYYGDQVETLRRVLLTGGLMILGEDSVARVFMGILVSMCWLLFVTGCHPYVSKWDNTVATLLSAQVVVTLVSGMALQLYSRQPADMRNDVYQNAAFGAFLIVSNVLCFGFAVAAVVGSVPLVQKRCCCCCRKWLMNGGSDDDESVVVLHDLTKVMPLQLDHVSVSDSDDDSSSNSRGARQSFEKNIIQNFNDSLPTPQRNVAGKDDSLPTLEIMETVKDCKVLFSFGSANGGLKLAKILRNELRKEPGWDCPSTAYIDNQDLLDRADTVSTPFEKDDKPVLDFDGEPIIKVLNPHWAEFYYGAMTYAEVVVILWDKKWRKSKWCQGEWQLFLKFALDTYTDDQFEEQQAYNFDLVVVFDGNSRESEEVMRL